MSNAEDIQWEDHWLTAGERKALRAVEATQTPQKRQTVAEAVDLTLRRQKAQQAKRRARLTMAGYVLCGAALPFIIGGYLWLIAG